MANKARKIRVGLFFAATLVLVAIIAIVFGGMKFWKTQDSYQVTFAGSVIGLEPGAAVYLNGITVGTVRSIDIDRDDVGKVVIEIRVDHGTPIHTDTHALLHMSGLTGLKVIDLRDGTNASPLLPPGAEIAAGASLIDQLEQRATAMLDESTRLMERANMIVENLVEATDPKKLHLDEVGANLAASSVSLRATLEENRVALRESVNSIRATTRATSDLVDHQLATLLGNADGVVGELRQLIASSAGPLRAAVFDLGQASRSFKELARDVRQKPSRLLFSPTPGDRKLP